MRYVPIWLLMLVVPLGSCEKAPEGVEVVTGTGAASGGGDAGEAPSEDGAAAAGEELREKLLALAVASECLRRGNTPPEQAANTMLALYKAHDIELETYTREMSRLTGDPAFQSAIEARTKDCPVTTAPEAADASTAAEDTAGPAADTTTVAAADTAPAPADTAPAPADTTPAPADTTAAAADTVAPPEDTAIVAVEDTRGDTAEPETSATPEEPHEVSFTGVWTGQLYGGPMPGSLRVTIRGRIITSAVATFGRTSIRLKGSVSEKGSLNLGGTSGQAFIRISGRVQRGKRGINGTWDGVIDMKRSSGRFLLKH